MDIFNIIVLGLVQGLTEFLPVSSSGHLVLVQQILPGISQPGILLEVILHAGTLTSVIFYYREYILRADRRFWLLVIYGTVPAVFVGLFFKDQIEILFENIRVVGFALLLTTFFNYLTDRYQSKNKQINVLKSIWIGIFQALAIIPGVSRSGSTIYAASVTGVDKKEAARFSFLLSVPAIVGANLLEIATSNQLSGFNYFHLLIGFLAAFISGLFAIKYTIKFLYSRRFKYFALYTLILGLLIVVLF